MAHDDTLDLDSEFDRGWHASQLALLELLRRADTSRNPARLPSRLQTRSLREAGTAPSDEFARGWRAGWQDIRDWLTATVDGSTPAHIGTRDHLVHMVEVYADGQLPDWDWPALLDPAGPRRPTSLTRLRTQLQATHPAPAT